MAAGDQESSVSVDVATGELLMLQWIASPESGPGLTQEVTKLKTNDQDVKNATGDLVEGVGES